MQYRAFCTGFATITAPAIIREGTKAHGYNLGGFAPTSCTVQKLVDTAMETHALQEHLALKQQSSKETLATTGTVKGSITSGYMPPEAPPDHPGKE